MSSASVRCLLEINVTMWVGERLGLATWANQSGKTCLLNLLATAVLFFFDVSAFFPKGCSIIFKNAPRAPVN